MLSLPEDWDYTTKGLAHICKDGVDSITTALKELERHGYLTRQRLRYDNGQLGDIEYTIHEQPVSTENTGLSPKRENPRQVKPEQAKPKQSEPEQENPAQLNTNPLKTKKSKKDKSITYPSIYPAEPEAANRTDGMDRIELIEAYREIIKENIEYNSFASSFLFWYISIISYYRLFVCSKFYSPVLSCMAHAAPQPHKRAKRRVRWLFRIRVLRVASAPHRADLGSYCK